MSKIGKQIVSERDDPYADAWSIHGMVLKELAPQLDSLLRTIPPIYFPWNLIFNKLLRVFGSPLNRDHWVDIQGYAQLVINFIDQVTAAKEVLDLKAKRRKSALKGAATRRRNRSKKLAKE